MESPTTEHDVAVAEVAAEAAVAVTEAETEARVAVAEAQTEAAVAIAEAHAEGEEWRTQIQTLITSQEAERHRLDGELNALRAEHQAMAETLSLIQSQQEPPPPNPPNPENDTSERAEVVEAEEVAEAPAEEPKPAERKRAHRWI